MKQWVVAVVVVLALAISQAEAQSTTTSTSSTTSTSTSSTTTTSTSSTTTTSIAGANNVTVSGLIRQNWGSMFVAFATVTMSTGYGPGGDAYTAAKFGLVQIDRLSCDQVTPTSTVAVLSVDNTNKKIRAWGAVDTVAEVAANTDIHAVSASCIAYGR